MDYNRIKLLIDRYMEGVATPAELKDLNVWYDSFDDNIDLFQPGSPVMHEDLNKAISALKSKLDLN